MKAHDGIVNLIPQMSSPSEGSNNELQVEDLEKDMSSLFELFYRSEKGQLPHPELMELFKEVISQEGKP